MTTEEDVARYALVQRLSATLIKATTLGGIAYGFARISRLALASERAGSLATGNHRPKNLAVLIVPTRSEKTNTERLPVEPLEYSPMPSSHESLLCQYRYDALDRLIGYATANEAQNQRFYCKTRLATEIQGALRHSIVQRGDFLLAQHQRSGNTLDTTLLATDQQRSVLHVISEADKQQKSIAYSPYGHRHAENGLLSLLGFNGERPDPVTGHYLLGNGYRAFNPVLMRFNSPDSWSPFGKGGLNSYTYCLGDPINSSDPNGHYKIVSLRINTNPEFITIAFDTGSPLRYKLRPGISRARGEGAILRKKKLIESISEQPLMDASYDESLRIERLNVNRQRNSSLQNIAIISIQSKSIPTASLPNPLKNLANHVIPLNDRHTVLEYIAASRHNIGYDRSRSYSTRALHSASMGIFDSSIPSSLHPTREAAQNYLNEIYSIRHPNEESVINEIRQIHNIHFAT